MDTRRTASWTSVRRRAWWSLRAKVTGMRIILRTSRLANGVSRPKGSAGETGRDGGSAHAARCGGSPGRSPAPLPNEEAPSRDDPPSERIRLPPTQVREAHGDARVTGCRAEPCRIEAACRGAQRAYLEGRERRLVHVGGAALEEQERRVLRRERLVRRAPHECPDPTEDCVALPSRNIRAPSPANSHIRSLTANQIGGASGSWLHIRMSRRFTSSPNCGLRRGRAPETSMPVSARCTRSPAPATAPRWIPSAAVPCRSDHRCRSRVLLHDVQVPLRLPARPPSDRVPQSRPPSDRPSDSVLARALMATVAGCSGPCLAFRAIQCPRGLLELAVMQS